MKLHLTQLSQFKTPVQGKGSSCPLIDDIRQDFWRGVKLNLHHTVDSFARRYNRLLNKGAVVALYGVLLLPSAPAGRTVYADPILSLPDTTTVHSLKVPDLAPQATLETVYINKLRVAGTYSSGFASGQCTAGVASRLPVTWSGNANQWAMNAAAQGYTVSPIPKEGSIAQTMGDSYLGHVAIVESVNPDGSFVIWEMNGMYGAFTTDTRTTTTAEFPNFIYV